MWVGIVSGEAAAQYDAIRLDSMEPANTGPLISADEATGQVEWKDKTDTPMSGTNAIRIVRRSR